MTGAKTLDLSSIKEPKPVFPSPNPLGSGKVALEINKVQLPNV